MQGSLLPCPRAHWGRCSLTGLPTQRAARGPRRAEAGLRGGRPSQLRSGRSGPRPQRPCAGRAKAGEAAEDDLTPSDAEVVPLASTRPQGSSRFDGLKATVAGACRRLAARPGLPCRLLKTPRRRDWRGGQGHRGAPGAGGRAGIRAGARPSAGGAPFVGPYLPAVLRLGTSEALRHPADGQAAQRHRPVQGGCVQVLDPPRLAQGL